MVKTPLATIGRRLMSYDARPPARDRSSVGTRTGLVCPSQRPSDRPSSSTGISRMRPGGQDRTVLPSPHQPAGAQAMDSDHHHPTSHDHVNRRVGGKDDGWRTVVTSTAAGSAG